MRRTTDLPTLTTLLLLLAALLLPGCAGQDAILPAAAKGAETKTGGRPDAGLPPHALTMTAFDWNQEGVNAGIIFDDLVRRFNAGEGGAQLEVQRIPGEPYWTKLNAMVAVNDAPDIFVTHASGRMKAYKEAGKIVSLSDAIARDPEWKSRFKDGVFDLMTFDGEIYGVPVSMTATGLFYNKEIFKRNGLRPPATYEELKEVVRTLRAAGVTPFAFGAKEPWTAAVFSEMVANRIGGSEPYDAIMAGGGSWEDPSFVRTGHVMQELVRMGAFPDNFLEMDYHAMTTMFKKGEAAMVVMGSWIIGSTLESGSRVKDKVGVVKFPAFEDGKGDIDTWLGQPDYNMAISASAADIEAAIRFLKMWSEPDVQARLVTEAGKIPVAATGLDPSDMPELSKELNRLMADMTGMFIFYDVGLGAKIGEKYNTTIQAVLAGIRPEDAMRELQAFTERNR